MLTKRIVVSIPAAQTARSVVCLETCLLIVGVRFSSRTSGGLVSGCVAAHTTAGGFINKRQEAVFPNEKLGIVIRLGLIPSPGEARLSA